MADAIMMKGEGGNETITVTERKTNVRACLDYFTALGLSGDFVLVKKSGTVADYEAIIVMIINGQCLFIGRTGPANGSKSLTIVSTGTGACIITEGDVFEVIPAYYGW